MDRKELEIRSRSQSGRPTKGDIIGLLFCAISAIAGGIAYQALSPTLKDIARPGSGGSAQMIVAMFAYPAAFVTFIFIAFGTLGFLVLSISITRKVFGRNEKVHINANLSASVEERHKPVKGGGLVRKAVYIIVISFAVWSGFPMLHDHDPHPVVKHLHMATLLKADYQNSPYWISDDEVLIMGYVLTKSSSQISGAQKPKTVSQDIILWNTNTGDTQSIATHVGGLLCYYDGNILYDKYTSRPGHLQRFFGPIGSERPIDTRPTLDAVRCRTGNDLKDFSFIASYAGPTPRELSLPQGRLFLPQGYYGPLDFQPNGASAPIQVGIGADAFVSWRTTGIRYYPFKGAYLMATDRPPVDRFRFWWLYPDGKKKDIAIAGGPWDRYASSSNFQATKAGIIAHVMETGDWDLRLVGENGFTNLVSRVYRYAVSPDGCKVAYIYQPKVPLQSYPLPNMSMVDGINICGVSSQ